MYLYTLLQIAQLITGHVHQRRRALQWHKCQLSSQRPRLLNLCEDISKVLAQGMNHAEQAKPLLSCCKAAAMCCLLGTINSSVVVFQPEKECAMNRRVDSVVCLGYRAMTSKKKKGHSLCNMLPLFQLRQNCPRSHHGIYGEKDTQHNHERLIQIDTIVFN